MNQLNTNKVFLCSIADFEKTGAKTISIPGERETVIVLPHGDGIKAYMSRCPHMGVPLETFPDHVMDQERNFIICSTHGARFNPQNGECVRGPCSGAFLDPCQIQIEGQKIYLLRP